MPKEQEIDGVFDFWLGVNSSGLIDLGAEWPVTLTDPIREELKLPKRVGGMEGFLLLSCMSPAPNLISQALRNDKTYHKLNLSFNHFTCSCLT